MKGQLTILLVLIMGLARAQDDPGSSSYTLDQCIEYALNNNVQAKNAQLNKEIANAQVKETIGIGLPQVSSSVSVQQSPTQPRFFNQYLEDDQGNSRSFFIDAQTASDLGLASGDVVALENIFQLKGSGDASLSINQLIFNGSYFVGLQAANAFKDLSVKQENQTKEQITMNVSSAFYNVLISRERLTLINSNLDRIDTLLYNTQAMYENGFAEKLDVDRIKVNRNNLSVNKSELENMVRVSELLLKFQMNYPYSQELNIQGNLTEIAAEPIQIENPETWDYKERPDYQVLQANQVLQELNIRNKYAEAIPVISAFANLGYSTQSPNFGGIFSTNSDFGEVPGLGPDKWYGYSTVGLRLSWNLFTGLQRTFQIQQEKLSLRQIENNFEALEKTIDLEIEQSQRNLNTALERLEVQEENMELAQSIFNVTQTKYEEGVGSNLEVIEADNALKESQTNYFNALYDALITQLELKKALGILHN